MPAAAVIPAPIAYIKVVAVKKLVVGSRFRAGGPSPDGYCLRPEPNPGSSTVLFTECRLVAGTFTLIKSECSKQAS